MLGKFRQCRVLVVGDLMLDEYGRGHVERISPEAPVPILNIVSRDATLGGAGNVVKNLRGLNVDVTLVGMVGDDQTGDQPTSLGTAQSCEAQSRSRARLQCCGEPPLPRSSCCKIGRAHV